MKTKNSVAPITETASTPEKKYTKVGHLPNGEWVVKDNASGEEKPASAFGDVTKDNTTWN